MDTVGVDQSAFSTLFARHVPHIFEKIFFPLDFESFKNCMEVSNAWKKLLTSESFAVTARTLFHTEIVEDEQKLGYASNQGDTRAVKRLLSSRLLDVNCAWGIKKFTPLCGAAHHGHKEVIQILLDNGADLNEADKTGMTPLHLAAKNGQSSPTPP